MNLPLRFCLAHPVMAYDHAGSGIYILNVVEREDGKRTSHWLHVAHLTKGIIVETRDNASQPYKVMFDTEVTGWVSDYQLFWDEVET